MQILINIFVTFIIMFWPIMLMMSPMMLDAPGSENDKSNIINIMLFLSYPIAVFLVLGIFGGKYFGHNGFTLAVISAVIIVIVFSVFGYFKMLMNLQKGIANTGYSVVEETVYYDGKAMEGADSQSFTELDDETYSRSRNYYAKDKDHFYYDGKSVDGVEIENLHKKFFVRDVYWFNNNQVIHQDVILEDAEPENFGVFEDFHGWTYSDNANQYIVYSYNKPLPTVDKETFKPLNDFLAKDKDQIFDRNKPILLEADASSFELLDNHNFARDKNNIYYLSVDKPFAIEGVDTASFDLLDGSYLKDKDHVYIVHQYESVEVLQQVDVSSFEITHYDEETKSDARDRNHFYYDGKIVGSRK